MKPRLLAAGLFVAAVAVIAGLQFIGGDDAYQINMRLQSANGLRDGSEVRTGGVPIGKVVSLRLGPKDEVDVKMALDPGRDVVGKSATARIVATNLIGEKYVELDPGDTRTTLPSGSWLPSRRVSTSVDLDQVLDVLDTGTRTRLAVLINETGFALTHRRADFNAFLHQLPPALNSGQQLVDQLTTDNHTVGEVVEHAERLVSRVDDERGQLNRMVDNIGQTAGAVAAKRAQLRQTLADAPSTLTSAQRLLTDLEQTTKPLGPAARLITATAPSLESTLREIKPFESNARPTLREVPKVAPSLTQLGRRAAPVIRRAVPTADALSQLTTTSGPASRTIGASIDDLLGLAEGWSRSIQLRDGLSHVFRGRASISVDTVQTLTRRLELLNPTKSDKKKSAKDTKRQPDNPSSSAPSSPAPDNGTNAPAPDDKPKLPSPGDVIKGLPNLIQVPPGSAAPPSDNATGDLLDYLLS